MVQVKDPYRWLENEDSEETKTFIKEQNEVTEKYLESCDKRQQIKSILTKFWNYPKFSVPKKNGKYYFTFANTGLQNH